MAAFAKAESMICTSSRSPAGRPIQVRISKGPVSRFGYYHQISSPSVPASLRTAISTMAAGAIVFRERGLMKSIHLLVPLALLSIAVSPSFAQHGKLLVAQKGDHSLAIVDPVAGSVVASVAENGVTGHEVAGSPDGRFAVVPIYGNSGVGSPGTDGNNIVVIDLAAHKIVANIQFD